MKGDIEVTDADTGSELLNTIRRNPLNNCHTTEQNRHGGACLTHVVWAGLCSVELKTTKNNTVRISPQQIAWNTAYSRSGGLSFILVKHLSSGDLILFRGARALDIATSGLAAEAEFRGSGFGELWDKIRGSGSGIEANSPCGLSPPYQCHD